MERTNTSEIENRRQMLEQLHRRVQEAESAQELSAELGLSDFAEIGDSLGLNQTQAIKLFNRLVAEGYVRLYAESVTSKDRGLLGAWVDSLTDKGLIMIGELPDANERLIRAFEAAIDRIEQDPTLDEPERNRLAGLARRGADVVQALVVRGAGDAIFKNLPI